MKRYQVKVEQWNEKYPEHWVVRYSTTYGLIWDILKYSLWFGWASSDPKDNQPYLSTKEVAISLAQDIRTLKRLEVHKRNQKKIHAYHWTRCKQIRKLGDGIKIV